MSSPQPVSNETRAKGQGRADPEQDVEIKMVDQEHSEGRAEGERDIKTKKKITDTLSPVAFRTDIGDQGKGGCREEGVANSLEDSHDEKGPERRGHEVSGRSEAEEKGPPDHEGPFGDS